MGMISPRFESLVGFIESSAGLLVPVKMCRLFFPETLGVGERVMLDFVLWVEIWRGHCERLGWIKY